MFYFYADFHMNIHLFFSDEWLDVCYSKGHIGYSDEHADPPDVGSQF